MRDRIQAFTVDSLRDLLNLMSISRFAEGLSQLQLRFMQNEPKAASPIAADLLRSALKCISKCNRQMTIKVGDSPTRKMLRARKPRSERSFRDSEVYFDVIVHVLRTIDYAGSPVVGLEISHLSKGCTWLSKPDGRWGVSSLRNLTSLKLGFDPETGHRPIVVIRLHGLTLAQYWVISISYLRPQFIYESYPSRSPVASIGVPLYSGTVD